MERYTNSNMKNLKYKTKFKLIWDILFNFKKFNNSIENYKNREVFKNGVELEKNFQTKVQMIRDDKLRNGIVKQKFERTLLEIPMFDSGCNNSYETNSRFSVTSHKKDIEKIRLKFSSLMLSKDEIEHYACEHIAKMLIDEGFLNITFGYDNNVLVTINAFGINN